MTRSVFHKLASLMAFKSFSRLTFALLKLIKIP
jgi:hypothetical protein